MPDEPEPPPPRGWPPGFGHGDDERDALLTLSELRGLRPLKVHEEAWVTGSAQGCVASVRRGRLGSDGDREWLPKLDPLATGARVEGAGARFVTPAGSRVRGPAARPQGSAGESLPARGGRSETRPSASRSSARGSARTSDGTWHKTWGERWWPPASPSSPERHTASTRPRTEVRSRRRAGRWRCSARGSTSSTRPAAGISSSGSP